MNTQAKDYWEQRLSADFSLSGTGHCGFSRGYNEYMYKLKKRALEKALCRYNIRVEGSKILDIGCGTGFFVEYYQRRGAMVSGIDITEASVNSLRRRFPGQSFYKVDIGRESLPTEEKFDVINAFDVLYHIVDDAGFARAVENIGGACKQRGWILITDCFSADPESAPHLKYRELEDYKNALAKKAIEIIGLSPIFHFMGKSPAHRLKNKFAARLLAKAIDSAGWLAYFSDLLYCPLKKSGIKLLVCRKN